jgi:predicted TIM-barrel fold metal-dependent hydrolase
LKNQLPPGNTMHLIGSCLNGVQPKFFSMARHALIGTLLFILLFSNIAEASYPTFPKTIAQYNIIDTHEHISDRNQAYKYDLAIKTHHLTSIIFVASPKEVLSSIDRSKMRFTHSEWNNNELLQISKKKPNMFYAFATFSPDDTQMVKKLKIFLKNGGNGLKLYNGHYLFYDSFNIKLDAPHLMSVYEYCEKNRIPIIFHVNARYYWSELKHVLDAYPKLTVNLPHFCMSLINLDRISEIFDNYENVYSDISCGEGELAYTTLKYISTYCHLYRKLVRTYKKRFLFATDMVLTDNPVKDEKYVEKVIACYREMLEADKYSGILIDLYIQKMNLVKTEENSVFNGLKLDSDTLRYIYEINPKRFIGIDNK